MPSKKKAPSAVENKQDEPVFLTYTGRSMNKDQIGKLRMRARDILADNVKMILDQEMKTQEQALKDGMEFDGLLTLNTTDLKLMEASLDAVKAQYDAVLDSATKAGGTYTKFAADVATQKARIKMAHTGQLRALSLEEKAARKAEVEAKTAEMARLQAEIAALGL